MGNVGSRLDDTGSLFFKDQSRCMFHVVLGLDLADVPGPGSFFRPLFPLPPRCRPFALHVLGRKVKRKLLT